MAATLSGLARSYLSFVGRTALFSAKGTLVRTIKFGNDFQVTLAELEKSQWLPAETLESLQNDKLRALIRHASTNVPYYRALFAEHGIVASQIQDVSDLKKIPVLTKDTLRLRGDEFVSENVKKSLLASGWTTGSTGTPINALRSRESIVMESASLWRQRRWAGIEPGERKAAVWGTIWDYVVVPAQLKTPPYWRYNWAENQLLLSYYHMSDETLPLYIDKLREFQPASIEGFPSTLLTIARFMKRRNLYLPVRAVFTSSETLYEAHRMEIEERFQTKVYDHYGQAERVTGAFECAEHSGLHVAPEYGVMEILKQGRDVLPGETGEVIGTGLNNFAMPLIRYQVGDLATVAPGPCACGRHMTLLSAIEGRLADVIKTPDGRTIPGNGVMGAFHGIDNIRRAQVIQETIDRVEILVELQDPNRGIDASTLQTNLQVCIGSAIEVRVRPVESIPTEGRKFRWMISKLPQA